VNEKEEDGEDGESDEETERQSRYYKRSDYVGRSNVKHVRDARKRLGLDEAFPRTDPLLVEFSTFSKAAGSSEKDTANKVNYMFRFIFCYIFVVFNEITIMLLLYGVNH
jgi:hypothetical protein